MFKSELQSLQDVEDNLFFIRCVCSCFIDVIERTQADDVGTGLVTALYATVYEPITAVLDFLNEQRKAEAKSDI